MATNSVEQGPLVAAAGVVPPEETRPLVPHGAATVVGPPVKLTAAVGTMAAS